MAFITGKTRGGLTVGTAADDAINGQRGNDILRGRAGDDILSGGAGSDTYIFESSRARNGFDTITDYSWSAARNGQKDILDLSAVLGRLGGGDSSRASIHSCVWLVEGDKGAWLYVDPDGLGTSAVAQSWALLEGLRAGDPVRIHLASGQDHTLTVRERPKISYGTTTFTEADANDGAITATCTITLTGDTFAGTDGAALAGALVTHVPDGLTAVVTRTSDTTAELSFTGKADAHRNTDDIANLTVRFGDAAFATVAAANVDGSTKTDLAIDFDDPAVKVVLFDLVDGWSSNYDGRTFLADETYVIYIRLDSDSGNLKTSPQAGAPIGADWGRWDAPRHLGSDDKIVLVGNDPDSDVVGRSHGHIYWIGADPTTLHWYTNANTSLLGAATLHKSGALWRFWRPRQTAIVRLWSSPGNTTRGGSWGDYDRAGNLSEFYQRVLPAGVLTSQAALLP